MIRAFNRTIENNAGTQRTIRASSLRMIKLMLIGQWLDFPVKKAQAHETEQLLIRKITESGLAHLYRVFRMPALLIAGSVISSRQLAQPVCLSTQFLSVTPSPPIYLSRQDSFLICFNTPSVLNFYPIIPFINYQR